MDDCTTNNDNALKAQSKAKLDKYKELAVKENMDFAPVVTLLQVPAETTAIHSDSLR